VSVLKTSCIGFGLIATFIIQYMFKIKIGQ